jgi:hypothetical protein
MPRGSVAGSADHNAGTIFRHWSIAASYECRESAKNGGSATAPWLARWALAVLHPLWHQRLSPGRRVERIAKLAAYTFCSRRVRPVPGL